MNPKTQFIFINKRISKRIYGLAHPFFPVNAGTRFTKEPPSTLYVPLGSAARFQWDFTFGDSKDWSNFEEIVWGKTDNNDRVRTKYITIEKTGNHFNPTFHASIVSRAIWTGNISQQQGCQMVFILKNVSKLDQTTYGCRVTVWGEDVRNGPVNLVVTGECDGSCRSRS